MRSPFRRKPDFKEADRRFREVIATIPEEDRRVLFEALTVDGATRAYMIGELHASGSVPGTTELLIDAAADPPARRC